MNIFPCAIVGPCYLSVYIGCVSGNPKLIYPPPCFPLW